LAAEIIDLAARRSRPCAEVETIVERAVYDVLMCIKSQADSLAGIHELARTLIDRGIPAELFASVAQMVINRMVELSAPGDPETL
jgi:hypothetical protein